MNRKEEKRDVVAAEWIDPQTMQPVRGQIVSRTKTSARVRWSNERTELVWFGDPSLRFLTAEEAAA